MGVKRSGIVNRVKCGYVIKVMIMGGSVVKYLYVWDHLPCHKSRENVCHKENNFNKSVRLIEANVSFEMFGI